jgi:hypothetical protein
MVGDGVGAVGRVRADDVPVLDGTGALVGALTVTGTTAQALRTSTDATMAIERNPIRTEAG